MPPVGHAILERLTTAYRRGEWLILAFDYDGTLTQDSGLRPHLRR